MGYDENGMPIIDVATWQTNPAGNYRYIDKLMVGDEPEFWGGAGAPHTYAYQRLNDAGAWEYVNPGEHQESANYFWGGVTSPQYTEAWNDKKAGKADALDIARLTNPGAVGQALLRTEQSLTGGGDEDDFRQELSGYINNKDLVSGLRNYYTPDMIQRINRQIAMSTPAAQAARDTDGDFGFLGAIAPIALSFALGPAGLGLSGWQAGALAGGLGGALNGGDPLKGALMGGIGGGIGDFGFGAADAAQLAGQGLSSEAIRQVMEATYGGGMMTDLMSQLGSASSAIGLPSDVMLAGLKGGIGAAVSGKDPLEGALMSGLGSAGTAYAADWNPTGVKWLDPIIERGAVDAGMAAAFGKDGALEQSLRNSLINAGSTLAAKTAMDVTGNARIGEPLKAGAAALLRTGDVETAILASLPSAAGGALDSLADTLGFDANLPVDKIASALVGYGINQSRAEELANQIKSARMTAGTLQSGKGQRKQLQAGKRSGDGGKAARELLEQSMTKPESQEEAPAETETEASPLDAAMADLMAKLESMGVEYAEAV